MVRRATYKSYPADALLRRAVAQTCDARRQVFDPEAGEFIEVAIRERRNVAPGALIPGPAVIVEEEISTVVSRQFDARIDVFGYIELTRRRS